MSFCPGELRQAKWSGIDFAEKVWRVPAERMKMKQVNAVPLSRQVLYLLQDIRSLARDSEFLFPALHTTKRPLSDNTLNVALRRLGFGHDEMISHGFRAMASTLLNESPIAEACDDPLFHLREDGFNCAGNAAGAEWVAVLQVWQGSLLNWTQRPDLEGELPDSPI